jgi:hypothetical protein
MEDEDEAQEVILKHEDTDINDNNVNLNTNIIVNSIKKNITIVFKVSSVYLLWIFLHYFASHLYIYYCVPNTYIGFFMSPFMTMAPHCQGLRWIVYNGADIIGNMWIILGTWVCTNILIIGHVK